MASSTLRLVIEKGPRKGESLEFTPRSTVRIGRLMKGNNLQIKDSGISSKHLEIKFNPDSGKWVVTDLDSSNGTFLNSIKLEALTPFDVSNGDDVKIGELTSFRVEIIEFKEGVSTRKNRRRQVDSKIGTELKGKVEEDLKLGGIVEITEEIVNGKNPRRKGASKNCANLGGNVEEGSNLGENIESGEEVDNRRNPRRRGASKNCVNLGGKVEESSNLGGNVENGEEVDNRRYPRRRAASRTCANLGSKVKEGLTLEEKVELKEEIYNGRNSRRQGASSSHDLRGSLEEDSYSIVEDSKEEKREVEGNQGRHGRGRAKKASTLEDENAEHAMLKEVGVSTRRKRGQDEVMSTRRITRSAKNVDVIATSLESLSVVEKNTTKGRGRKKKVEVECLDAVMEEKTNGEVAEKLVPAMVIELSEQLCNEPAVSASKMNVFDDTNNEHFVAVEVSEKVVLGEGECGSNQQCEKQVVAASEPEVTDATENEQIMEVALPEKEVREEVLGLKEQLCEEPVLAVSGQIELHDTKNDHSKGAEILNKEVPEKAVDLREQPHEEPVVIAYVPNIVDNEQNEQLMKLRFSKEECVLSVNEQLHVELMDEINQQDDSVAMNKGEKHCLESMVDFNQLDNCVASNVNGQSCAEFIDEPNQKDTFVSGSSLVEGVVRDAVSDVEKVEDSDIEELDTESDAKCCSSSTFPETDKEPDMEKMTLEDWLKYLEVHLPKQIYAAADEVVGHMRKQAIRVEDFVLQQQKEKSKLLSVSDKARS